MCRSYGRAVLLAQKSGALAATLRVMSLEDVAFAAALHRAALSDAFFVRLGPAFLRAYYRTFATSPASVGLIAELEGTPVGFIVGTIDEGAHYRHVTRTGGRLAVMGIISLIWHPTLARQFMRTRARRYVQGFVRLAWGRTSSAEDHGKATRHGVLAHLAVDPDRRHLRAGTELVNAFVRTASAQGTSRLQLTVAAENDPAASFYERLGWTFQGERYDLDGRMWQVRRLDLG